MIRHTPLVAIYSLSCLGLSVTTLSAAANEAQTGGMMMANTVTTSAAADPGNQFSKFIPQAMMKRTQLDYGTLDAALEDVVLYLGPSIRRRSSLPNAGTGSRLKRGHRSAYRLEGSRVQFSFFNDQYIAAISEYRRDLEQIGTQLDLPKLSKDEQLAYWLNLHNVTVIEQIALQYPERRPSDIKINGVPLRDAKILNIKNTPLSLRDIRENIVYPNWSNPLVIYGFFLGDIGSPMIQNYAITANDWTYHLKFNAEEFVNSLRGIHETSRARKVSRIYDDVRRFYFPNFEGDLTSHLLTYANEDVAQEIQSGKPFEIDIYDTTIADLKGGERDRAAGFRVEDALGRTRDVSAGTYQYLREIDEKTRTLRQRGMIGNGGTVTIEDLPTIDVGPLPQSPPSDSSEPENE